MQPDSSLSQDQNPVPQEQSSASAAPQKKAGKFNIQIVFLVILVLATAGLGYWAFQTNGQLAAATTSLNDLNGKYEALGSEKDSLSSELTKTQGEIETANSETETTKATLATTKSDISKANQAVSALKTKMEKAAKYLNIMRGMFEDEETWLETLLRVIAIGDGKLLELLDKYLDSESTGDFLAWIGYLLTTTRDILQ